LLLYKVVLAHLHHLAVLPLLAVVPFLDVEIARWRVGADHHLEVFVRVGFAGRPR
jgi:hypothetical protein